MASYDEPKVQWCYEYMNQLRTIMFEKFDETCADILENIESHIFYTEEEMEKRKNDKTSAKQNDSNIKPFFNNCHPLSDIKLGLYGKCQTKSNSKHIEFDIGATCILPRAH